MLYVPHVPAPPLNAYIDDLYYIEGPSLYSRLKIHPMPSLQLMINFGSAFQVYAPDQASPFASCTGCRWMVRMI